MEGLRVMVVIPARGGSKGIRRKNLQPVAGRSLLARAVDAARGAATVDDVVVSTDDAEIAAAARALGAIVVDRPAEIASDTARSEDALLHAVETLGRMRIAPDILVFLQCTTPLTTAADVDATVRRLVEERADSALTAAPFRHFLWRTEPDGSATGINHDKRTRQRRQDMPEQYLENGGVYAMRTKGFLEARHRFFGKTVVHVVRDAPVVEVDAPADLLVADALARAQDRALRARALPAPVHGLALDFDGVFTDNRVLVREDGTEAVSCDRSDGLGLSRLLRRARVPVIVLSTEKNPVVRARCGKLGVECRTGLDDKASALRAWIAEKALDPAHVVYVGNDENDLDCMAAVGCAVAPADAHADAKRRARIVLDAAGGRGALREICDLILDSEVE